MRKARNIGLAAVAAAGLTLTVSPAQAGRTPPKKTVSVEDYYFTPSKLTVKKGTIMVWRWSAFGGDGHDVVLAKGPRGVKKFASEVFFADEVYRKRLTVPGRYSIICSLHPDQMKQTITVRR